MPREASTIRGLGNVNRGFTTGSALANFENTGQSEIGPALDDLSFQTQLLSDTESRKGEADAIRRETTRAKRESDLDDAQFERATRGFGLSDRQKRGAKTRLSLSRALNRAGRTGSTRRGFLQRAEDVQRSAGGFAQNLFGTQIQAEGAAAANQTDRSVRAVRREADKDAANMATAGQVIGMAMMLSSEKAKDKRGPTGSLLQKLKNVRVERWNYKGDTVGHVGPYAEEFNEQFGVGEENPTHISIIDALGITLGAVKELNEKIA